MSEASRREDVHEEEGTAALAAVAPGRGYFGALDSDCLEIRVDMPVVAVIIELSADEPTFLNLAAVEFEGRDGPIEPDGLGCQVQASSVVTHAAMADPARLLHGNGLHTQAETGPWWTVRFAQPLHLLLVRVRNRSDYWGVRSRSLRVAVERSDGTWAVVHDGMARKAVLETLRRLNRSAMTAGAPAAALDSVDEASRVRRELLAALSRRLRAGILPLVETPWRHVVQLLDVWSSAEPDAEEWTVLAGFLLAQHGQSRGTAIRAMARVLGSRERLRRLDREVNALAAAYGRPPLALTRHGFSPVGKLSRNPGVYLDHLGEVVEVLAAMGREPVLAYGTLLGAVRDGSFIPHDDDVDVLYRSLAADRGGVETDMEKVAAHLRSLGYRVDSLLPNNLNMHVFHPRTGALMDIFPCWLEDAGLMLHMEGMKLRPIPPEIVYPAGRMQLHGRSYPAPADPVAFLLERYGPGWKMSDPFFEWPWKLEEPKQ